MTDIPTQAEHSRAAYAKARGHEFTGRPPKSEKRIQAAQVREICGGISDMTLWRWLNERDFPPPIYIARRRYWREADVLAWLEAQPQHGEAA